MTTITKDAGIQMADELQTYCWNIQLSLGLVASSRRDIEESMERLEAAKVGLRSAEVMMKNFLEKIGVETDND